MNSKEPLGLVLPIIKAPHILTKAFKVMKAKHFDTKREIRRADGKSTIPIQQISLKITNSCNLRCKTCGQWGETGYNYTKSPEELKKVVPVERYLELCEEVKSEKPIYYIWGGEPFLYPELMKLTKKIKENKSFLAVVTNATQLEMHGNEIVEQGWDALMFSLDGPEEIHDEVRGRKGTFEKLRRGVETINKLKKDANKPFPWMMALITVNVLNAHKLDEIIDTAKTLKVDCAIVYYSWFTDENIGLKHTKIFEKTFNITPSSWKGYLFDHNVNAAELIESRRRIKEKKAGFPVIYIPDLKDSDLDTYYKEPGSFFGYGPCISTYMTVEIMPNGDVSPCRDYPDYVVGNVMNSSLNEIWNGERYIAFRKALIDNGGTFPICSRCCGLMGW